MGWPSSLVARSTSTLAEFLAGDDRWAAPDLSGVDVVAQPHCHHHGVMGWSPDAALLRDAGANLQQLGGCCGLAGNFGVEQGHYEVSVKVAEQQLLPAMDAKPDAALLADGFSCRTQIRQLENAGHEPVHLAHVARERAVHVVVDVGDANFGTDRVAVGGKALRRTDRADLDIAPDLGGVQRLDRGAEVSRLRRSSGGGHISTVE